MTHNRVVTAVVMLLVVIMAGLVWNTLSNHETLEGRGLILTDSAGRERVRIEVKEDSGGDVAQFVMFDENGEERFKVMSTDHGSELRIINGGSNELEMVANAGSGSRIQLLGEADKKTGIPAMLSMGAHSWSTLKLIDQGGKTRVELEGAPGNGGVVRGIRNHLSVYGDEGVVRIPETVLEDTE